MVSHKRSLHRQSGRGYANDIDENVVQWERVWVSPLSIPSSATSSGPNGKVTSNSTAQKLNSDNNTDGADKPPTFSFKVKVWAQLNDQTESIAIKDGDDDDYINLVAATQLRKGASIQVGSGSLTAADIRGAVGGGEDVSISSYTSNEAKPKEDKPVEGEKPVEVISEEKQTDAVETTEVSKQQPSETESKEPVTTSEGDASAAAADKELEKPTEQDASNSTAEDITEEPKSANNEETVATTMADEASTTEKSNASAAAESEESKPAEEAANPTEEEKSKSKPASGTGAEAVSAEDVEIKDAEAETAEDETKPADASKQELSKEADATKEAAVIAAEPTDIEMKDASAEPAAKSDESADVEMKDS